MGQRLELVRTLPETLVTGPAAILEVSSVSIWDFVDSFSVRLDRQKVQLHCTVTYTLYYSRYQGIYAGIRNLIFKLMKSNRRKIEDRAWASC